MRKVKDRVIILLFIVGFSAEVQSYDSFALENITSLSNQNKISYEDGIQALLDLPDIFSSRNFDDIENQEEKEKQLLEWKTLYNQIHNKLFILTHIARIEHQLSRNFNRPLFVMGRYQWKVHARVTALRMKREQLQSLEQMLQIISSKDFDHSKHQFNQLSDLAKVNIEGQTNVNGETVKVLSSTFSKGFSKGFSKSFSKGVSKGGYGLTPFSTSPNNPTIADLLGSLRAVDIGAENIRIIRREISRGNYEGVLNILINSRSKEQRLRELRDYSQSFVFGYRSSQAFDMSYMDISLSEEAVQVLDRLGISGQTLYFAQRDLSNLYRTAPASQQKSAACVGFALAFDMEFELNRKHQLRSNESLSPWSVYAALRYNEDNIQTPDCLELDSLADTISEGTWEMDVGINLPGGFTSQNFCLTSSSRDTTNHTGNVSIKNMERYIGEVSFPLLKSMIDHRMPPVLLIDSDAREEAEDWININRNGSFAHVFVVVGYGTDDIDPFTLRTGPYFLVRDSLASQPIHYKVSAKNLLDHSLGIFKVSQLERH